MRKCLFIHFAQPLNRGIGVRGWLKISNESIDFTVAQAKLPDAYFDLVGDALPWNAAAGTEAAVVAKRAPAGSDGPVHVWTSKLGVDAYLLDASSELLSEELAVAVIAHPGGLPIKLLKAGVTGRHALKSDFRERIWRDCE
jgi:hypothetical protein